MYRYDERTGTYQDDAERFITEWLDAMLEEHHTTTERHQILHRIKATNSAPAAEFCGPDEMICVENGVLDLSNPSNPTLKSHSPDFLFRRCLPVRFDSSADCTEFREFLTDVVKDEDRKKLQEFVGYCLHHWGMPINRVLLLTGPTNSGKSTFMSVVEALLGRDNVSNESLQRLSNNRFSAAELHGKYANIRADLDSSVVRNVGLFKELAAGDRITAERKNQDPFQFQVNQKQLYATNQVPEIDYMDRAFHERWLHCRFPETIPHNARDEMLVDRLTSDYELTGILNWALEGYERLIQKGRFSKERTVTEKRALWRANGDTVDQFIHKVLLFNDSASTPKDDVYEAYSDFCKAKDRNPGKKSELTRRLKRQYDVEESRPVIGGEQVRCYDGVEFGDKPPVPE